jgi:hypothetical protein
MQCDSGVQLRTQPTLATSGSQLAFSLPDVNTKNLFLETFEIVTFGEFYMFLARYPERNAWSGEAERRI